MSLPKLMTQETWDNMNEEQRDMYKLLMHLVELNSDVATKFLGVEAQGLYDYHCAKADAYCDLAAKLKKCTAKELLEDLLRR